MTEYIVFPNTDMLIKTKASSQAVAERRYRKAHPEIKDVIVIPISFMTRNGLPYYKLDIPEMK